MKTNLHFTILLILVLGFSAKSQDTITVQTFTFGSPQDAWFIFPSDTVDFEKIIMKYTLKCDPSQNPPCGEWDYQTSTILYDYTGLLDSSINHQPLFTVNGNATDTLKASITPTYTYSGTFQYYLVYDDTTSLDTFLLGSGSQTVSQPFATEKPVSKAFYLWKASELTAAGMISGSITGMRFNLTSGNPELKNLSIRIKQTNDTIIDTENIDFDGFTEVYRLNTQLNPGMNHLAFLQSFLWNGVENLIVEISFENTTVDTSPSVSSSSTGFNCGAYRNDNDRYVGFHGNNYISVAVTDSLNTIDSQITVSFWAYGNPLFQPQNGTSFEGVNAAGNRVVNGHVPWSNSNVYWDAGNNGSSYDRINKLANPDEISGKWNHWGMTKNVSTQVMKIYLNGNLWHSGTNKSYGFDEIDKFLIGKGNSAGSSSFSGKIDEFAVFKAELSQLEIEENFKKPITVSHPKHNDLIMYFTFNEGNGISCTDSVYGNTEPSYIFGATNPLKSPDDYITEFVSTQTRPDVVFEQGNFTSHIDSLFVVDSTTTTPMLVVFYSDSVNNPGHPTDTIVVWPAGYYNMVYATGGVVIDSIFVLPDTLFVNDHYDYYHFFPQIISYEMGRYITPYGIGLSLGNGWTWTYDVSDYRTLLTDSVRLSAGNWQELLDLKFLMIKGTPPRNIISIQNLWNGNFNYGDINNPFDDQLHPITVKIPNNAVTGRWKSRITGHGMDSPGNCAEFCPKTHYFHINGNQVFSKLVWRNNCGLNPLYPQGGTWVYNRSNWCPGAEVETYNFEITPFLIPGDTITLSHKAQYYAKTSGWSFYEVADQLVFYGAPNFSLDAAIENVLVPTTDDMWRRMNPACTDPVIIIKNTGSATLTSLDIDYGVVGGQTSTYQWTGHLDFLETTQITLGNFHWTEGASKFKISIKNPNGSNDEYPHNNEWTTDFVYPVVMPESFVIELRTNSRPWENHYTLKDDQGNTILNKSGLSANTLYRDTVHLTTGCYIFKLTDSGNDGLTWWANAAQGSGYIRFRKATAPGFLVTFDSDFGSEVYQQFTVGLTNETEEYIVSKGFENNISIVPNPAEKYVDVSFNLAIAEAGKIEIIDMLGKNVFSKNFAKCITGNETIDIKGLKSGVYFVRIRTNHNNITARMLVR